MLPPSARPMRPRRPAAASGAALPPEVSAGPSPGRCSPLTRSTYLAQLAAALAAINSGEHVTLPRRLVGRPARTESRARAAILAAMEAVREVQAAATYGSG